MLVNVTLHGEAAVKDGVEKAERTARRLLEKVGSVDEESVRFESRKADSKVLYWQIDGQVSAR